MQKPYLPLSHNALNFKQDVASILQFLTDTEEHRFKEHHSSNTKYTFRAAKKPLHKKNAHHDACWEGRQQPKH